MRLLILGLKTCGLLGLIICPGPWTWAQAPDPSQLTLDRIFASDDFRGERDPMVRWLNATTYVELRPAEKGKSGNDLIRVDAKTGLETMFLPGTKLLAPNGEPIRIDDYSFSVDGDVILIYTRSEKVWRRNTRGDYWTFRISTGHLVKHGKGAKPSSIMFGKLSPDGRNLGYVRDNNLFVEPVDGGEPLALTSDGSEEIINGTFDWVYEEEFDCRDGWRFSPDGKAIAYWQLDTKGVPRFTMIDNVQGKYPKLTTFAYPKTGEQNSACRIGVVLVSGGKTTWMDIPGDTKKEYYLPRMDWTGRPGELMVQRINRLQNQKDYLLCEASNGKTVPIHSDNDAAWVEVHDESMSWSEKSYIPFLSEKEGWRSLYLLSHDKGKEANHPIRVTREPFDVIRLVWIDTKQEKAYFLASPDSASEQYLYCVSWGESPSKAVRLTPASFKGSNDYQPGPDGTMALWTHSSFGEPPVSHWIDLATHKVLRPCQNSARSRTAIGKLARTPVEFFKVDIGDGVKLDGWLMKPPGFDPDKKYPILFHIYGEPAGQTVVDRWGGSNYLWHLMLTQRGYLIASIDNRGTHAPKGRDWRKSIYKNIGTLASMDQLAAAKQLLKRSYIDKDRVSAWGWSGGGSMTLNLMFRYPEIYKTGMAVAPVPDMTLYDTIYQERYMGLPQTNPKEYATGSPIHHASGLRGNLLIVHGTGDDNVHYQGTEKLVDRLVAENKRFTLMPYPNRSHSVSEGKNTTRHLYSLLTSYLETANREVKAP